MDQGRTFNKIFETKPEVSRKGGRPRMRWLEDVKKDLREMKVKRWQQKAVDREELASHLRRPRSQRTVELGSE
jgi:hypothetical protein